MSKITLDRSVLEQALTHLGDEAPLCSGCAYEWGAAIHVLRAALEQNHSEHCLDMVPQGEQEPVAICEYCENERPVIHAPQPVEQEPVAWQSRMRTKWMRDGEWWPWQECSKEVADDYKRAPVVNDWEYESRALYTHPQPRQPLTDEVQSLIGSMVAELRAHRYCGDCYPENGWPKVNKVLADYAAFKRAHWIGGKT